MIHVAYTRFEADKNIMDALVGLRKKGGEQRPESQSRRRHYGAYYTLTMLELSRNRLSSSGR